MILNGNVPRIVCQQAATCPQAYFHYIVTHTQLSRPLLTYIYKRGSDMAGLYWCMRVQVIKNQKSTKSNIY